MAKKPTVKPASKAPVKPTAPATRPSAATSAAPKVATQSATGKSAVDKPASSTSKSGDRGASLAKIEVTHERIAARAYEIFAAGTPGSQDDHWHQAVRELRGI